ncbi:MAG: F0F1 ATP synthase subunit epsilon [Burkholderiales bacterium]|nr:F0F1 ATP synthase subunit epsilon [Burkholderiales bacterium]
MAMTVQVDVVSIEGSLFSGLAEFIVAPAELGEVGIYPGHAPMIARMKPGAIRLKLPNQPGEEVIFVSSGILEVQPRRVTILSDLGLLERDADEHHLREEKRKVEETLRYRVTDIEFMRIQVELTRALSRLEGMQVLRHRNRKI